MARYRSFNPHSTLETRAHQAWLILIGMAARRQTVTYKDLAIAMFDSRSTFKIGAILGHIAFYCEQHKLPHLNCIVVGKVVGTPGRGIPKHSDKERERVFARKWYLIVPPSPEELKLAWDNA